MGPTGSDPDFVERSVDRPAPFKRGLECQTNQNDNVDLQLDSFVEREKLLFANFLSSENNAERGFRRLVVKNAYGRDALLLVRVNTGSMRVSATEAPPSRVLWEISQPQCFEPHSAIWSFPDSQNTVAQNKETWRY